MPENIKTAFNTASKEAQQTAIKQANEIIEHNPGLENHRATLENALAYLCEKQTPAWHTVHKNKWGWMKEGNFSEAVRTFKTSGWGERAEEEVLAFEDAISPILNLNKHTPKSEAFRENTNQISTLNTAATLETYERFLTHLLNREGFRNKVYRDTEGKLTVGVGHLVLPEDNLKLGDVISNERARAFLEQDAQNAFSAAKGQAAILGVDNPNFLIALGSVNFQLGPSWYKDITDEKGKVIKEGHENTWTLMKQHRWSEAAEEAARSEWNNQTPVRVKDFQEALRTLDQKPTLDNNAADTVSQNAPVTPNMPLV